MRGIFGARFGSELEWLEQTDTVRAPFLFLIESNYISIGDSILDLSS